MQASTPDQIYFSDPSNNVIAIPNENCPGKKVHVDVNVKYGFKIEYYLLIKMTSLSYVIIRGQVITNTNIRQHFLHCNSEYVKAYTLHNGDIIAIS